MKKSRWTILLITCLFLLDACQGCNPYKPGTPEYGLYRYERIYKPKNARPGNYHPLPLNDQEDGKTKKIPKN